MSDEEKKETPETSEQPAEEPTPVTLEDLVEKAPVVSQGPPKPEEKKEQPKAEEEPKEESEPSPEKKEEKKVDPESETESKVEPKEEEETTTEEKIPERFKEAWDDHQNKKKWQGELTRKSQVINKYSDEEIVNIQAEMKLREELKEVSPEPLPEYLEYEVGNDEITGDPIIYKLPSNEIQKIVNKEVEKARKAWTEKMAPEIAKGEQAVQEAETHRREAEAQTAITGIRKYFEDFPSAGIDLGDDPIQTLNDIHEAGEVHPDFDKLLNLRMVSDRSQAKGITMKEAHIEIFGKSEQERIAKERLRKEQETAPEEKPGPTPKAPTPQEEFEKEIGIGVKRTGNVFD